MKASPNAILSDHSRSFEELRFAYPVVSRRARGLSLGLNVNPDKICNFHCLYCQVDRTTPPRDRQVDVPVMLQELDWLMDQAASGTLWNHPRFSLTPAALRRVNDIAFAGDGEPTTYTGLGEAIRAVHELKQKHGLSAAKTIVLTNATRLGEPSVLAALSELKRGPYEIWAKLDAGTDEGFRRVNGVTLSLDRICDNIARCARDFEVTLQSLFPTIDGRGPDDAEIEAWIGRIVKLREQGANLRAVQVYTTARKPSSERIGMLPDATLDALAGQARQSIDVPVEVYYGREWEE